MCSWNIDLITNILGYPYYKFSVIHIEPNHKHYIQNDGYSLGVCAACEANMSVHVILEDHYAWMDVWDE